MEIQSDFKELLELFNANKVEYVVVGGYALAFHGAPRFTGDIDFFVRSEPENAKRILESLRQFGFESLELSEEDFTCPDRVIQIGVPPVRIDIMTSLTGVSWQRYLIHSKNGQRIPDETFSSAWQRLMKRAIEKGLKERFAFHDLKAKGVSDFDGDKKLASGHRTDAMVDVYDRKPKKVSATR